MSLLLVPLLLLSSPVAPQEEGFRPMYKIGIGFNLGFPSMSDEDLFADEMNESGVAFDLDAVSTGGVLDLTVDASERLKIRGGVGFGSFNGAYTEEHSDFDNLVLAIFTLGLSTLFDSEEEVIDLHDSYVSIEAEGYYVLARNPGLALSVGGGPVLTFASRSLESPLTSAEADGSSLGFMGSLRVDQEGDNRLLGCLPVLFFAEGGYRNSTVELEGTGGFELDFSGLFVRTGIGLGFR